MIRLHYLRWHYLPLPSHERTPSAGESVSERSLLSRPPSLTLVSLSLSVPGPLCENRTWETESSTMSIEEPPSYSLSLLHSLSLSLSLSLHPPPSYEAASAPSLSISHTGDTDTQSDTWITHESSYTQFCVCVCVNVYVRVYEKDKYLFRETCQFVILDFNQFFHA